MRISLPALLASLLLALPAFAKPVALVRAATVTGKRRATEAPTAKKLQLAAPPASLVALNTHESFVLRPDGKGGFDNQQRKKISTFLRCHHSGRRHAIAPRLLQLLYATAKHFEFHRIVVVAGYRAPKIARQKGNPRSPHKQGAACDFRVEGIANTTLRDFLRDKFDRVGIGYYPNSGFVHLDVRTQKAFWIDESGPGERARYLRETDEAMALERAVGLDGPQGVSPREEELDRQATTPEAWGTSPQSAPTQERYPGGDSPPASPSGS